MTTTFTFNIKVIFSVIILNTISSNLFGASTSIKAPGSETNLARAGSSTSWSTGIGNAQVSDDNYVGIVAGGISSNKEYTDYYYASNFSLNVPDGVIVQGISVSIERRDVNNAKDDVVSLVQNGTVSGDNKSLNSAWSAETTKTYGGTNDNWGLTLTSAEVNSANFGVVFSVKKAGNGANPAPQIDKIGIAVSYIEVLPVELISFETESDDKLVTLSWESASEINNDYYSIEKLNPAKDWIEIGTVDGAGNSATSSKYNFKDHNVSKGTHLYRLKQTDFDGSYTYSKTSAVTVRDISNNMLKMTQNGVISINIIENYQSNYRLVIYNITGETQYIASLKGKNLEITHLQTKGLHFYRIYDGSKILEQGKLLMH